MIGLSQHYRHYLREDPTDMRKSFDGLSGLITNEMGLNAMDGNVYLFINRKRDRMKMLVWESGGFMLYYKRLEQGTFDLPCRDWGKNGESLLKISCEVLVLMISGIKGRGMHDPWKSHSGNKGYLQCDGYPVYDKVSGYKSRWKKVSG